MCLSPHRLARKDLKSLLKCGLCNETINQRLFLHFDGVWGLTSTQQFGDPAFESSESLMTTTYMYVRT